MASVKTRPRRRKLSPEERAEKQREALDRATRSKPNGNDTTAILGFQSMGIDPRQVETFGPAQNVFTYAAWQAKGRQVRKGQHGVKLTCWAPIDGKGDAPPVDGDDRPKRKTRPVTAHVFHVSQTDKKGGVA